MTLVQKWDSLSFYIFRIILASKSMVLIIFRAKYSLSTSSDTQNHDLHHILIVPTFDHTLVMGSSTVKQKK